MLELNSQQLSVLLGVSTNRIRALKTKGLLYSRLSDIGYRVVGECKRGKNVIYLCTDTEVSKRAALKNFCKETFNVNQVSEFVQYYLKRTEQAVKGQDIELSEIITKSKLGELIGVSDKTISKWDNILIEQGILSRNGYVYVQIQGKELVKTSEYAFKRQYRNMMTSKKIYTMCNNEYHKGMSDYNTLEFAYKEYENSLDCMSKEHIIRIKNYKLNADNPVHIATMNVFAEYTKQAVKPSIEPVTETTVTETTVKPVTEELETTKKLTIEVEQPIVSFSEELQPLYEVPLTLSLDLEHTTELSTVEPTVEPTTEVSNICSEERTRVNPAILKLRNLGLI